MNVWQVAIAFFVGGVVTYLVRGNVEKAVTTTSAVVDKLKGKKK